jgi:hypothetical protein
MMVVTQEKGRFAVSGAILVDNAILMETKARYVFVSTPVQQAAARASRKIVGRSQ